MSNKFLEKYPQLHEPKIGDRVRIIKLLDGHKNNVNSWYYNIGAVGQIVEILDTYAHTVYRIQFDRQTVSGPGIANVYSTYREEIEIL
jgi:hypothetical protein